MQRLSVVVAFLLACVKGTSATDIALGAILMQLRSEVDTSSELINSNMQSVVTRYLDSYFGAYYENSEPTGYFGRSSIVVGSYGVIGVEGSFTTTLEIDGTLSFNYDPPPSSFFIDTLVRNAFQGLNEDIFIGYLVGSDDEFLQRLQHIILEIDESTVIEVALSNDTGGSNGSVATTGIQGDYEADDDEGDSILNERWAEITIYAVLGFAGLALLVTCCCFTRRACCKKTSQVEDVGDIEKPIKVLELPLKKTQQLRRPQSKNEIPLPRHRTARTGASTYDRAGRPPSPERSLASQDSSKFTYTSNMNISKVSFGSFSRYSMDMPSIDLGGAQKPNTISPGFHAPPFGSDISAIENHRDLSLIQEEEDEEGGGRNNRCLPPKPLAALDEKKDTSSLGSRNMSSKDRSSRHKHLTSHSYRSQESTDASSEIDTSSDVISDLRNLSILIKKQRNGGRSLREELG